MTSAITIEKASVSLGGVQILNNITAEIAPGEFVGVFGPNGAGKSTLMRALLGLCPLQSGSIRLCGESPGRVNQRIGYMPQTRSTLEGTALSARSLVRAVQGGRRWGLPIASRDDERAVSHALELAGATSYADRPFSVLSGGEKQRITLAQALLGSPSILILDEPLASLDPKNQQQLVEHIAQIREETSATVLFIAHDVNPLLGVMSRVLYLAGGSAALGSVDDVITSESLTRLYGVPVEVVRASGRIFIVSSAAGVTESARHG